MTAQITSTTISSSHPVNGVRKPELISKIESCKTLLNDAILIPGEEGIITAAEDRFSLSN